MLAAQVMGADMAYCGSCFITAREANAVADYKRMVIDGNAGDIVYTDKVSGTHSNFLRQSLERAGITLDGDRPKGDYGSLMASAKAWRDIWSAGQGIGIMKEEEPVAAIVDRMRTQYLAAGRRAGLMASTYDD